MHSNRKLTCPTKKRGEDEKTEQANVSKKREHRLAGTASKARGIDPNWINN